jgi:hypothetical protein
MPWSKIFAMLLPVISAILAALTANNVSALSMAADPATGTEVGVTGLAGLGSLVTLLGGLFATWRASGRVNPTRAAEVAALATLAATCMARGDGEGNRLVSLLAEHFAIQNGDKKPTPETETTRSLHDLLTEITKRARIEAAEAVAKGT